MPDDEPNEYAWGLAWGLIALSFLLVVVQFGTLVVLAAENRELKAKMMNIELDHKEMTGRAQQFLHKLKELGWKPT